MNRHFDFSVRHTNKIKPHRDIGPVQREELKKVFPREAYPIVALGKDASLLSKLEGEVPSAVLDPLVYALRRLCPSAGDIDPISYFRGHYEEGEMYYQLIYYAFDYSSARFTIFNLVSKPVESGSSLFFREGFSETFAVQATLIYLWMHMATHYELGDFQGTLEDYDWSYVEDKVDRLLLVRQTL